jgi:hypothetical protein
MNALIIILIIVLLLPLIPLLLFLIIFNKAVDVNNEKSNEILTGRDEMMANFPNMK